MQEGTVIIRLGTATVNSLKEQQSNAFGRKKKSGGGGVFKKAAGAVKNVSSSAKAVAEAAKRKAAEAAQAAKKAAEAAAEKTRRAAEIAKQKAAEAAKKKAEELKRRAAEASRKAAEAAKQKAASVLAAKQKKAEEEQSEEEFSEEDENAAYDSNGRLIGYYDDEGNIINDNGEYVDEEGRPLIEEEEGLEDEEEFDGYGKTKQNSVMQTENATIIRLDSPISQVVTFEEAFGEHSNLFGNIRAKMATKRAANTEKIQAAKRRIGAAKTRTKIAKQQDKSSRKTAKQVRKGDVKVARKTKKGRKRVARVGAREAGQQARISKRTNAMRGRQNIKTERQQIKDSRRPIEDELPEEEFMEEELTEEEESYPDAHGGGEYIREDDDPIGPDDSSSGEYEEEEGEEEEGEEEEGYDTEEYEDSFDGEVASSFDGDEKSLSEDMTYEFCGADGVKQSFKIPDKVKDCAMRIEWNKENVSRLKPALEDVDEQTKKQLAELIDLHKQRAMQLESKMDAYVNDSNAAGGYERRKAIAGAAIREAKKRRMLSRIRNAKKTIDVEAGLNPEISNRGRRIVIPPVSNSSGESTSSLDGNESESSFSAKGTVLKIGSGFSTKNIIIGIGVGVLVVAAIIAATKKK